MTDQPARERRILAWMCVLIAANQLGFGAVVPVLPLFAQSFGVSQSAIGTTIAVYGLARFLVAMPTGQLADRLGRRPTIALGGILSALGNLWCAEAVTYPDLVAARFLAGAGAGLVLTAGQVVLADISAPARRGRTMAIYQGVFLFAVGIGPFPGGLLAQHLGLAAPFAAYAAAGLVVGLLAWFAVEETRPPREDRARGGHLVLPDPRALLRALLGTVGFRLVGMIALMQAIARTGALFSIVPVIGKERLALTSTEIGLGFALGSVLGILFTYPAGVLVDRFGRKTVIVPATLGSGISMLLFCVAPSYAWFLLACIAWGVASAVGGAAPAAYAADCAPPGMNATAMSTYRMLGDFGYVVGPLALGALADLHGARTSLAVASGLLVAVGILFARFAPETHRRAG